MGEQPKRGFIGVVNATVMQVIIVGAGTVGAPLVDVATGSGNEVVVVEQDGGRANEIADAYDCAVLHADATDESTIQDAGADRADALITTTGRDPTNLFVCLLGAEHDIPTVVSLLQRPAHRHLFAELGVYTVAGLHDLAAESLYRVARQPAVSESMPVAGDAAVFRITVGADAPIADTMLVDARSTGVLPDDVLVVAVRTGDGEAEIARSETTITPGDEVTVYSSRGTTADVTAVFSTDVREDGSRGRF
ncbi:potassium channel family protein [Halobacterium salinarum]|uniref:potassium channel family protein n=2 Tax=Halobacteriaceae TaxID=2236 RepID=UPI001F20ABD6|nr:TrkA family potassium uptake protein [Halobacterium salinarum]